MNSVSTDTEYLMVMLCKLIDALRRQGTYQDGNWGYPSFQAELEEMQKSLMETEALEKYPKTIMGV
jgi:hypothetical protein